MKISVQRKNISFDAAGYYRDVVKLCKMHMSSFEEDYLKAMSDVISEVDTRGTFKEDIQGMLKHISTQVEDGVITYLSGIDEDSLSEADTVKAYVIAFGMGKHGLTGIPVHQGPYGRTVWNDNLSGQQPSTSLLDIDLPDSWNHYGKYFVEIATQTMGVHFRDMVEDIMRDIANLDLGKYLKVG